MPVFIGSFVHGIPTSGGSPLWIRVDDVSSLHHTTSTCS